MFQTGMRFDRLPVFLFFLSATVSTSPSASTISIGQICETFVAEDILERGWRILSRNLRTPYGEVDIVAIDESGDLIVLEVKARSPLSWATGADALRPQQQERLLRALAWCGQNWNWAGAMRLDLASVVLIGDQPTRWEHFCDI